MVVEATLVVGAVVGAVVVAAVVVAVITVVVVVATVVVVVGAVAVVVGAVAVVVGPVVVVVGPVVVVVGRVVVGAVVVVVGAVVEAVVDSTVAPAVAPVDAAAAPAVGPDGRTEVPATDGRATVLCLEGATDVRGVVFGFCVPASSDEGTAVSGDAALTELSVANEATSAFVDEIVVVVAASNCKAEGRPDSPVQPTSMTPAAATERDRD